MAATGAMACTNFIVGKKASADGSVICSYNADSYGAFMWLYHYPAAKHQPGEMRKTSITLLFSISQKLANQLDCKNRKKSKAARENEEFC